MTSIDEKQEIFLKNKQLPILKVKKNGNAILPKRIHLNDVGLDITPISYEKKSKYVYMFNTQLHFEPPAGYYLELVPRSSLIFSDFILANSIGIIDPGYRGALKFPLRYLGEETREEEIEQKAHAFLGQRVVQILLKPLILCELMEVDELSDSQRNDMGFGSSGQKS
jgi:dUTP pyrophosphatase